MKHASLYESTCAVLGGTRQLDACLAVLRDWIQAHLDVSVLHIEYEAADSGHAEAKPRLIFVFESEEDLCTLFDQRSVMLKRHARSIKTTFESILRQTKSRDHYELEELVLIGVSFSMIAMDYASGRAHLALRSQLIQRLQEYGVLDILDDGGETIMVFQSERARKLANSKSIFHIRRLYYDYLQQYDHLGLLQPSDMDIRYDSWENLGSLSPFHIRPLSEVNAV